MSARADGFLFAIVKSVLAVFVRDNDLISDKPIRMLIGKRTVLRVPMPDDKPAVFRSI